ncbi:MAG: hypothetical protein COU25_00850 [Candidatus Levybacteria bacterium CG10_big_fil_rev_8_21_14_0_10_35_13]|nr:MAG: hypothetical protein COU25_00850 [Candidatus Levybacteria bacterium CG10_big_fil_rev_8_21_14_0_10_35_13]
MNKPQIIGLGLSGLIGSRIVELLSDKYKFIDLSISKGVDITRIETLEIIKNYKEAKFVLHLAAKANVDGCEKDKVLGKDGSAWKLNVEGVKNVAEVCLSENKKIIYVSTDFVFDGTKKMGEKYSEDDTPNPINWYAKTKYEGEKAVQNSGADYVIARFAYPYRAFYELKKDFVRVIKERLEQGQQFNAVEDHIITPTFIDDIAYALDVLIKKGSSGIFHIVGSESLSPYEASLKIADVFGLNKSLINKTTRDEFFKDKATRPFNLALKNDKISKLGVKMSTFEEGLIKLHKQLKI